MNARVYLVGDDEALDHLAELCRHLPLFELARVDALPSPMPEHAILVIGMRHPRRRAALYAEALSVGARHVEIVPDLPSDAHAGARALLVAAELVRLLVPELGNAGARLTSRVIVKQPVILATWAGLRLYTVETPR